MVSNLVVEIAIYNFDLFHYTLVRSRPTDFLPSEMEIRENRKIFVNLSTS